MRLVPGLKRPLLSGGETSPATTVCMGGRWATAARREPPAVAALRAGRDARLNRLLRLPMPEPYLPARAVRDRPRAPERTAAPARAVRKAKPGTKGKPAKKTGKRVPGTVTAAGKQAKAATKATTARGHQSPAAQKRRGGAAKAQTKQGTGRSRRSRTLEGQRYG